MSKQKVFKPRINKNPEAERSVKRTSAGNTNPQTKPVENQHPIRPADRGQLQRNENKRSAANSHHLAEASLQSILNRSSQLADSTNPTIQAKLSLGPVGDRYEQEADQVAKQVVTSLSTTTQPTAQRQEEEELQMKPATSLQRQEEEELQMKPAASLQRQEEEELQMKPAASLQRQEEEELQMKPATSTGGGPIPQSLENRIQSARGGGQSLPEHIRGPMEQAIGADFSRVHIHTSQTADTLNRSINARAFTSGKDLFFRSGEYNPDSSRGQELLAHELTHTVQQGAAPLQRRKAEGANDSKHVVRRQGSRQKPQSKVTEGLTTFDPMTSLTAIVNRAVIQRVSIGTAAKPTPKKSWEVMGGFASKHLIDGELSEDEAKKKWTERWQKQSIRAPKNTVVSKQDLTDAITAGDVTGTYPQPRGPRGLLMVKVKGYTVKRKYGTDLPNNNVQELSQIGVEGTTSESLFYPDHLDPETSK